jgi:ABC-type branched-subunit amino acid transport system ATPase component
MQLVISDICSGYSQYDVLHGVCIEVEERKIVSIIGPNGAGKSTLFRTIFGILKPRKGYIQFREEDITKLSSIDRLRKGITYVPQGRCNFPMMTVKENLEMGAYLRTDRHVKEDIMKIYWKIPMLGQKKDQMVGTLSGGEQQVLEMAMSYLLNPKMLLLDEPTLGLAPNFRHFVFENIVKINQEGVTILIVEQNAKLALGYSNFAYVLELGRNRFQGPAEEILNNPEIKKLYLGG